MATMKSVIEEKRRRRSEAVEECLAEASAIAEQVNSQLDVIEVRKECSTPFGVRVWFETHLAGVQEITVDTTEFADVPQVVNGRNSRSEVEWEGELVGTHCDFDGRGQLREYATYEVREVA